MSINQIPTDGYGVEKTLYGHGVRLKAKNLTTARSTTLKITGMSSGAVWYVDVLVQSGTGAVFSPPATSPPREGRDSRQRDTRQQDTREQDTRQQDTREQDTRQQDTRQQDTRETERR